MQGRFEAAASCAIEALKFANDIYGGASLDLVPSILLLANASIDHGNLKKAETCLTQATFLVSKGEAAGGVSSEIKAALYRVMGRLYTVRGNGPLALRFLAGRNPLLLPP